MNKRDMMEFLGESLLTAKHDLKEWKTFGPRYIGNVQIIQERIKTIKDLIKIVKENTMSNEYEKPYAEGESQLVNEVIELMKDQVCSAEAGADWTAIDELLRFVPRHNLINFLPDEAQEKYKTGAEKKELTDKEIDAKLHTRLGLSISSRT